MESSVLFGSCSSVWREFSPACTVANQQCNYRPDQLWVYVRVGDGQQSWHDDQTFVLPPAVFGAEWTVRVGVNHAANSKKAMIDPAGSEVIVLNGTPLTGGYYIWADDLGDMIK
jgi:hypothetical protein